MRISIKGALAGAFVGAVARGAVVALNLGELFPLVYVLPSAAVGLLVGAIAGATSRPWLGALLGALLSAVVFELFMLPCASLLGTLGPYFGETGAGGEFLRGTLLYALQMGLAGALAGGIGGLVGRMAEPRPTPSRTQRDPAEG